MSYINLITTSQIKKTFLLQNKIRQIHFFTLEEFYNCYLYQYKEENVLLFAIKNALTYKDSKDLLDFYCNYKGQDITIKEKINQLVEENILYKDEIKEKILVEYPTYYFGYDFSISPIQQIVKNIQNTHPDFKVNKLSEDMILDLFNHFNKKTLKIDNYPEAFIEVMFILNKISKNIIENNNDFSNIEICCPSSYLKTLISSAKLYNLNLDVSVSSTLNIKEIKNDILNYTSNLDIDYLNNKKAELEANTSVNDYTLALTNLLEIVSRIFPIIEQIKKIDLKQACLLIKDYLLLKMDIPIKHAIYKQGIKVVTSLKDIDVHSDVYIMGFSDSLLTNSKDNDYLEDSKKEENSYQLTSYQKDLNKKENLETLIDISNNLHFSYSLIDNLSEYHKTNIIPDNLKYDVDEKNNLILHTLSKDDLLSFSLDKKAELLYMSIFKERYDKTKNKDPYFSSLYSLYGKDITLYNNDFKLSNKDETIFKDFFDSEENGNRSTLSHSSLDMYLNNPFNYLCNYIYKIKYKRSISTYLGNLAHYYFETGEKEIDFEKEFNNMVENDKYLSSNEYIDYFNKESFKYFVKKAYENSKKYAKYWLNDEKLEYKPLILPTKEKEFDINVTINPTSKGIENNCKPFNIQVKIDGIFTNEDRSKAFIIDYKYSSSLDSFFALSSCLLGRKQQLPLYALMFNYIKEAYSQYLGNTTLLGACLLPIKSKDFTYIQKIEKLGRLPIPYSINPLRGFILVTNGKNKKDKEKKDEDDFIENYVKITKGLITNDDNLATKARSIYDTYHYFNELNDSEYDLSKLNIKPELVFTLEESYSNKTFKDYANYSLLNISALEIINTVKNIRNGIFNINKAYINNTPLDCYSSFSDISFEEDSQRHYLKSKYVENQTFNDFTLTKEDEEKEEYEESLIDPSEKEENEDDE